MVYLLSVLLIFEHYKSESPGFFALPVFNYVSDFRGADVRLKKFLELFTTDVGRQPADEEFALLELFGVIFQLGLLELLLTLDNAVKENVVRERENAVVGLFTLAFDNRKPLESLPLSRMLAFRCRHLAESRKILQKILLSGVTGKATYEHLEKRGDSIGF